MLTLSKSSLWYRRSCAACKLKLSSTLVNGQINKCKRATEANKNNSGSPKTVLFSAMTAEKKEKRLVFTSGSHRKWTIQLLLWLRRWGVFISRAFEKYYWNLILKKWKKIILNLPASFLNFPRGDGVFFSIVPRVATHDWFSILLTGGYSQSPQATIRLRRWRGKLEPLQGCCFFPHVTGM